MPRRPCWRSTRSRRQRRGPGQCPEGRASDPKIQAILELALAINATHGQGSAPALEAAARTYGLTDAEILETIAHVAVNILTNSVNNTVGTILDFPKVERVA
ncbi:hypothetical protein PH563_06085 [Rhizobium phaseoli]|nr:hypothetical protein [Rhizobium phaseoli]MDK4725474.1 hypothetical protein [Rhizobium phaseoli]